MTMSDLTQRARDVAGRLDANVDHARGCAGRCYACTCGYDTAVEQSAIEAAATISELVERIERLERDAVQYVLDNMKVEVTGAGGGRGIALGAEVLEP